VKNFPGLDQPGQSDPQVFLIEPVAVELVDLLEHLATVEADPEVRHAAWVILGHLDRQGADMFLTAIGAAEGE
jgi:hypothetical protein